MPPMPKSQELLTRHRHQHSLCFFSFSILRKKPKRPILIRILIGPLITMNTNSSHSEPGATRKELSVRKCDASFVDDSSRKHTVG